MKAPVFKEVFGQSWDDLPPAMRRRYEVTPGQNQSVKMRGNLKISMAKFMQPFKPFMRVMGLLIPIEGDFPCKVIFQTGSDEKTWLTRKLDTPNGELIFASHWARSQIGIDEVISKFICWRATYQWNGERVIINHAGYGVRLFGRTLPLPVTWLFGKGYAEEVPTSENSFKMFVTITSPIWGEYYRYEGAFTLED